MMGLEAASLLVASLLHLTGFAHGQARLFSHRHRHRTATATGAGIAEAVIGIVVACGAIALSPGGAGEVDPALPGNVPTRSPKSRPQQRGHPNEIVELSSVGRLTPAPCW